MSGLTTDERRPADDAAGPATVNTVLGPVAADGLGVVAVHDALLVVVPGAEHAFDVHIDRAAVFDTLATRLIRFREAGGGTVVDSTGMFDGRDVRLAETLSRATGVHIVGSTGMGPEEMLGGYFLTPQTDPPTPWPADRFADLFEREITEGMVVPRVERRATAGLVAIAVSRTGVTATDESLVRGAARAARATGCPLSLRFGRDAATDLDILLDEQLPADRVMVGGLDRRDALPEDAAIAIARRGAFIVLDHVGLNDDGAFLSDEERVDLVRRLVSDGLTDRILVSSGAIGVAFGTSATERSFDEVLTHFSPLLRMRGVDDADIHRLLVDNPRRLLAAARMPQA